MPYAILEAMDAGLPVVATRFPGAEELVKDGETGVLADMENDADIADKMLKLIRDADLRTRMGRAGQALVGEHYSLDRFLAALERVYSESRG